MENMKRLIAMLLLCGCSALAEDAAPQYFPVSTNSTPVNAVSPFGSQWYSEHLQRMQEPSLLQATNQAHVTAYRFTYLPTWGRPLAVRTVVTTNQVYVRTVRLTGDGGYDPGYIGQTTDRVLTNGLPQDVSQLIDRTIWNGKFQPETHRGCDGSEWIVEGVKDGKYRLFTMWTPEAYSKDPQGMLFVTLSEALAELSGDRMDKIMQDCHTLRFNKDPLRRVDPTSE